MTDGDNEREIEKVAAIYVCRLIMREVKGPAAVRNTPMDFQSEPVTLRDLHEKIQRLAGTDGWSALVAKGGR